MVRVLLPLALLLIAFWVYSIVDCALQPPTRHRGVSKPVWLLIVVLIPVLGGILWFVVGRGRPRQQPQFRAPDDNPDFLGSIGSISDQDERIRRLEAELAALDAEDPSPDGPRDEDSRGDAGLRGSDG
ncbi:PLD nuclease N-terminal domain-containing protein [Microbacterium sp.]|uniref:PLD nuclease N-terminal domain-containing protein n=1 Tax=Microbacterium sp. TaxID=51671 RepID=UPI002898F284|nr:PLD nuclease N-terminal domain-containing protein [Microbacterium sp.]